MKLWAIPFTFLISILLTSCSQRRYKPSFDCSRFEIGKEIPLVDSLGKDETYHDYISWYAKRLNIPDIVAGENDSTIRIWFWQPGDTVFLLNIEKHGSIGFGHLLGFGATPPKFVLKITRCLTTNAPVHGWERLFDTLRTDNIGSIPDGKPNGQLLREYCCTGGGRIYVEYQQGSKYRFYSYFEPGYYQFVDSNAGKLNHFLTFLQDEFSLHVYEDMTSSAETPIRNAKSISERGRRRERGCRGPRCVRRWWR